VRYFVNPWLLFLLAVFLLFGAMEAIGYWRHGWAGTLTNYVRTSTKRQPIMICLIGIVVGVGIMHFWGQGWCG